MDRQERVVVEAVDPPVGISGGTNDAAQVLLDDRNVVHDLSETVFPFFCQANSHERAQVGRGEPVSDTDRRRVGQTGRCTRRLRHTSSDWAATRVGNDWHTLGTNALDRPRCLTPLGAHRAVRHRGDRARLLGMASGRAFEIEPIRATRTFEAAIEHLTEAVERAGLRTGDRLPNEGVLAEQLGISKPTLRQALRVLELSGLVAVRRGKSGGIFVVTDLVPAVAIFTAVKLEEAAAVDVLRARRVLERAVVFEAMQAATAADLLELERTVDLLERYLGERPSVMRADAMFHRALVRSCRNETIQTTMRGVARGLAPIRDAYSGGLGRDKQTLDVHRRQLDAMRRRDDETLDAVLDEHFRMLEAQFARAIGRRWSDLFGERARRPA
jgi:GntR family transcriptional regulator, transcriptional repressor for pyruvate dehydrogenase complex